MKQERISDFIACIKRAGFTANKAQDKEQDFVHDYAGYIRLCLVSGHWMHVLGYPKETVYGQTLSELQRHLMALEHRSD